MNFLIYTVLVGLLNQLRVATAINVTLFQYTGFRGQSSIITINSCTNLGSDTSFWNDRPLSLDSNGACVTLCVHANCEGRCVSMASGSPAFFNLWAIDMVRTLSSIQPCDKEEYIQGLQHYQNKKLLSNVTLYEEYLFSGNNISMDGITECTNINPEFRKKVSSVSVPDTCVVLCVEKDCQGKCVPMQPGSFSHWRLRDLDIDKQTTSVKPCYSTKSDPYVFFRYRETTKTDGNLTEEKVTILRGARLYRPDGITCGDGSDAYGNYWAVCEGQTVERFCNPKNLKEDAVSKECSENSIQLEKCNCRYSILEVGSIDTKVYNGAEAEKTLSYLKLMVDESVQPSFSNSSYSAQDIEKISQTASLVPFLAGNHTTLENLSNLTTEALVIITQILKTERNWNDLKMEEKRRGVTNVIHDLHETMFNLASKNVGVNSTQKINNVVVELQSQSNIPKNDSDTILYFSDKLANDESNISVSIPFQQRKNLSENDIIYTVGTSIPFTYVNNSLDDVLVSNNSFADNHTFSLNTKVLTFKIKGHDFVEFKGENVQIVLSHNAPAIGMTKHTFRRKLYPREKPLAVFGTAKCAFWNTTILKWSTNGCRRNVSKSNAFSSTCMCNHLTSFSVLMGFHDYGGSDSILNILTWILCPLSMISLFSTLFIISTLNAKNKEKFVNIAHLCAMLLVGNFLLLLSDKSVLEIPIGKGTCTALGMLSHYVWLCAFGRMAIEGVILYEKVVKVFQSKRNRLHLYSCMSYGIPMLIVGMTAIYAYWNSLELKSIYSNGVMYCWLTPGYLFWTFKVPVFTVIFGNLIVLVRVIHIAVSRRQNRMLHQAIEPAEKLSANLKLIKGTVSLSVLLGLTWIVGCYSMTDFPAYYYLAHLFTVLNASQGIFIFIFHCCMNELISPQITKSINCVLPSLCCFGHTKNSEDKQHDEHNLIGVSENSKPEENTSEEQMPKTSNASLQSKIPKNAQEPVEETIVSLRHAETITPINKLDINGRRVIFENCTAEEMRKKLRVTKLRESDHRVGALANEYTCVMSRNTLEEHQEKY